MILGSPIHSANSFALSTVLAGNYDAALKATQDAVIYTLKEKSE